MPSNRRFFVYVMSNASRILYVGVTSGLATRMSDHKQKTHKTSFTARYNVTQLVYFEEYSQARDAIAREKQLKAGSRKRKVALITDNNPGWRDLSEDPGFFLMY
jgi:putative endonuclease